jgi:hypothetical protein
MQIIDLAGFAVQASGSTSTKQDILFYGFISQAIF